MKTIIFFILLAFTVQLNGQSKLIADTGKSKIQWRGERVLSEHNGTVKLKSGSLTMENDRLTGGEFVIDMNTIEDSEDIQKLEGHLRSDAFFAVDKYPESRLVITESTPFEKGNAKVKGTLTIRDKTHPIEFNTVMQKKDDGLWFFSKVIFDRSQYDVRHGSGKFFENLGDKLIYDDIEMRVSLSVK